MNKIFSCLLMTAALVAGCGQQDEQASVSQPAHNVVIVRLPADAGLDQLGQGEVRAVNVDAATLKDGETLERFFNEAEPVSVAAALDSDETSDESSSEMSRGRGHGGYRGRGYYGRGYYNGGYNWNWGYGYRNINYGPYYYNYSNPYACGGYNYYPYYAGFFGM